MSESPVSPVSAALPFKLSEKTIRTIIWIVAIVVAYFFVTGKIRKQRSEAQYAQAGSDPNTNQAIAIRQACNPSGISLMIDFDSTYEEDLMTTADEISNLEAVGTAYSKLYNDSMYARLEKELNAEKYAEWIRRAKLAPSKTVVPGAPATKKIYALRDTQVFSASDSSKVKKTVKAGQTIGTVIGAMDIKVNGVTKGYYKVSWSSYLVLETQGLVLANDTKFIS